MVAMCTTMTVFLSGALSLLCRVQPVGPVRGRKLRNMEDWVYSKKPVTLDILVNIIIIAATMVVLVCTVEEQPDLPVRVWLGGYAVHCLVHMVLVLFEYRHLARRRRRRREAGLDAAGNGYGSVGGGGDGGGGVFVYRRSRRSYAFKYDVLNLWASLVWGIAGLCWLPTPSRVKLLWQNAPWLYRLTMICLAYDGMLALLAMLFSVGTVICFVCFSLSRIIAIMYTAAGQKQEGASEANLSLLPKYRFDMSSNGEKPSVGAGVMVPMDTGSGASATECDLLPAGAECCICLCSYDGGIELHALPCNHRFHAKCIEQWLNINGTCPVCNYNILEGSA